MANEAFGNDAMDHDHHLLGILSQIVDIPSDDFF